MRIIITIFSTAIFVLTTFLTAHSQTSSENYNYTYDVMVPGISSSSLSNAVPDDIAIKTIQYFDGLGRPKQTVQKGFSYSNKDVVKPFEYNEFGIDTINYLPYVSTTTSGAINGDFQQKQPEYYYTNYSDVFGIAPTMLEKSPLQRIFKQGSAGAPWQIEGGHPVSFQYLTNDNSSALKVRNWTLDRIVITYNPMGDQVIKKEYYEGGTIRQTVDFTYNIKGWLTKINNPDVFVGSGDYFAMQLLYNQKLHDSIKCSPRFNGNISFIRWRTEKPVWSTDNELAGEKGYAFNYDKLNRLSGNSYYEYASGKLKNTDAYQELINEYDKNGNIKSLKRQGKSFGSPITIDNLTYTYTGNQVIGIDDAIAKNYDYDFFDNGQYYYISHTPEYVYDANGNLTQDVNKEIINISYNELNLPEIIDFKYNNRIEYQYDALGNKKRQLVTEGGRLVKTTDFIGNFVYENNVPVYNSFDEGRIVYKTNGTYFAETYIKDHLGNIRVVFGSEVAGDPLKYGIRQVNAYYPFGMNINSLTANKTSSYNKNEYLYNGKMFQDELGLDWLDYGARFYDAVLARFHTLDPLSETFNNQSPFVYADNNPANLIDYMGMNADGYLMDEDGNIDPKPVNNEGGNNYDVIYNKQQYTDDKKKDYDVSGNKTGIAVSKQVLNSKKVTQIVMTDSEGSKTGEVKSLDKYETKNGAEAQLLMNFVDKNTNVEWSNTSLSQDEGKLNVLMTSHESDKVTYSTSKLLQYQRNGYAVEKDDHIHPEQYAPNASGNDLKRKELLSPANNAVYRILYQGQYYPY